MGNFIDILPEARGVTSRVHINRCDIKRVEVFNRSFSYGGNSGIEYTMADGTIYYDEFDVQDELEGFIQDNNLEPMIQKLDTPS